MNINSTSSSNTFRTIRIENNNARKTLNWKSANQIINTLQAMELNTLKDTNILASQYEIMKARNTIYNAYTKATPEEKEKILLTANLTERTLKKYREIPKTKHDYIEKTNTLLKRNRLTNNTIIKENKKQKLNEALPNTEHPTEIKTNQYHIINAPFQKCTNKITKPVDILITDPPYTDTWLIQPSIEFLNPLLHKDSILIIDCPHTHIKEYIYGYEKLKPFQTILVNQYEGSEAGGFLRVQRIRVRWHLILIYTANPRASISPLVKTTFKEKTLHKWQKEETLYQTILKNALTAIKNPTPHIMDIYMGSGTSGSVALKNNCYYTGIEIDPTYYNISAQRLKIFL